MLSKGRHRPSRRNHDNGYCSLHPQSLLIQTLDQQRCRATKPHTRLFLILKHNCEQVGNCGHVNKTCRNLQQSSIQIECVTSSNMPFALVTTNAGRGGRGVLNAVLGASLLHNYSSPWSSPRTQTTSSYVTTTSSRIPCYVTTLPSYLVLELKPYWTHT